MRTLRQRKYLFALLAILTLLFAGCKAESPTAPPVNSGGTGSGSGTPPPAGSSVVITASNLTPVAGSVSAITVTVTQNNNPVPNGTAVELETTKGKFVDPATGTDLGTATLLTTNGGKVVVNLTSDSAGAATVRAVVNNVASTLTVNFQTAPIDTGNPGNGTTPTISSISPTFGTPAGGQPVTITGTNFRAPVRVLFDFGAPIGTKEAFVTSVTPTQITVVTPAVDLAGGQALPATIRVIVGAGAPGEASVTAPTPFNFQLSVLTPAITTLSPASGPIDGGTRVTIFGSGFQAPVQVFFGSAEAQVLNTRFDQIIAIAPTARDTDPNGSGTITGPVAVKVININSATNASLAGAFRYVPKMQITAAGPLIGPATGGTKVTIDGTGFNDPVAVTIGGQAAQPIKVSGTQIVAVTLPLAQLTCGGSSGPIIVTNVDNGDSATATGLTFTYRTPKPTIIAVNPNSAAAGTAVTIDVSQALPGVNKFTIGDKTLFPTSATPTPDGTVTSAFSVTLPTASSFTFPTAACTVGGLTGTQTLPLTLGVTYLNVDSGCTDTAANALTITPPSGACQIGAAATINPSGSTCANAGSIVAVGGATGTTTITVSNSSSSTQNLIVNSASVTSQSNGTITVSPAGPVTIAPGATPAVFTVTVDPTAAGAVNGTVTLTTNDPTKASVPVCISANGT
jgi:hypothetical protein